MYTRGEMECERARSLLEKQINLINKRAKNTSVRIVVVMKN